jgi:hypothetical protein
MADTTYSQNVVGYINTTIAAGKYAMIGNTLINGSDPAQTNNNVNALFSGLYSQPIDPPDSHGNTVLFVWDTTSGYSTWYYFNAADAANWGSTSAGPDFFNKNTGDSVGVLPVSAGFLLLHHGATVLWTNTFTVQ